MKSSIMKLNFYPTQNIQQTFENISLVKGLNCQLILKKHF